ncbi:unnamed protein product [Strongylus vulgaris]|uniref:Uncharacterized protein n=1 Tax=Strongylus vulgaris TaxID=40348 RepID=A0A3P7JIZ0_STRVU|nr:unnamed protein product [Strongylus vulgaris]
MTLDLSFALDAKVSLNTDDSSEAIATVWLPIYSTANVTLFQSLDSCSTECSSTTWSTFHPDPKSDIHIGYDKTAEALV